MTSTFVPRPYAISTNPADLDPKLSHEVGNQDVEIGRAHV